MCRAAPFNAYKRRFCFQLRRTCFVGAQPLLLCYYVAETRHDTATIDTCHGRMAWRLLIQSLF